MPVRIERNPPDDRTADGGYLIRVSGEHNDGICQFRLVDVRDRIILRSPSFACSTRTEQWVPIVSGDRISQGFTVYLDPCRTDGTDPMVNIDNCGMGHVGMPPDVARGGPLPPPPSPMTSRRCPDVSIGEPCSLDTLCELALDTFRMTRDAGQQLCRDIEEADRNQRRFAQGYRDLMLFAGAAFVVGLVLLVFGIGAAAVFFAQAAFYFLSAVGLLIASLAEAVREEELRQRISAARLNLGTASRTATRACSCPGCGFPRGEPWPDCF